MRSCMINLCRYALYVEEIIAKILILIGSWDLFMNGIKMMSVKNTLVFGIFSLTGGLIGLAMVCMSIVGIIVLYGRNVQELSIFVIQQQAQSRNITETLIYTYSFSLVLYGLFIVVVTLPSWFILMIAIFVIFAPLIKKISTMEKISHA